MRRLNTLAEWIVANRRTVIAGILLVTVLLGSGIPAVTLDTSFQEFVGGTASSETNEYVESNFRSGPEDTDAAYLLVRREYHVVSPRDMLEQLRYEERLQNDSRVAPTLAEDEQPTGITNVITMVTIQMTEGDRGRSSVEPLPEPRPSITTQRRTIEEITWDDISDYERFAIAALNDGVKGPPGGVYAYVPKTYDSRFNRTAQGTVIYIYQDEDLSNEEQLRSQTAMRELANEEFRETAGTEIRVYGDGIVNDELNRSTTDSLLLVGPVGLLLVVAVLLYAFRDPLDVLLALFGVGLVLVWTFGFMGWAGIEFNQLFVSIPVFLMGLSIDYAIHSFMRYREERGTTDRFDPRVVFLGEEHDPGLRPAMAAAVGGVGSAFVLVTLTTATGFASSVTSPVAPIREFGIVAAVGIIAALVVFGALIPALKLELDRALEARGYDRRRRAFATGEGRLNGVLEKCVLLAERAPWLVVGVALLATTVGVVGATTVDTSFSQKDFTVEETPEWMDSLPEPLRPGNYTTHRSLTYFEESGFVNQNNIAHILVRGNVTDPETLERVHRGHQYGRESNATLEFGRNDIRQVDVASSPIQFNKSNPVLAMRAVAAENETFNATFQAADTDGDGIPDRNLETVYDAFYRTSPDAAEALIHREDGDYRAVRAELYTDMSERNQFVASEMRAAAAIVDAEEGLSATATGRPVVRAAVQQQLFTTILRSFALTLAIVFALLVLVYRVTRDSASLGVVTMLPVLFAVAWILGTMAALGMRFNVLTALITSFTIGLGVDYSIHVSERYVQELDRQETVAEALRTSVYGTGGALLGSAITTAGGFAVLVFAILGPLRQFGIITAMTIVYAFLGSVVVLPSLLVLWTRYAHGTDVPRVERARLPLDWRPQWWRE